MSNPILETGALVAVKTGQLEMTTENRQIYLEPSMPLEVVEVGSDMCRVKLVEHVDKVEFVLSTALLKTYEQLSPATRFGLNPMIVGSSDSQQIVVIVGRSDGQQIVMEDDESQSSS